MPKNILADKQYISVIPSPTLNKLTASRDRNYVNYFVVPYSNQLVHHIHSNADMVWYNPDDIANQKLVVASG